VFQHFCAMATKPLTNLFFSPPQERVPLYWVGMGEETRRKPTYRWHGLKRGNEPHLLWQYTLSGRGRIQVENGPPRVLERGHGFFARVPSDHLYFYQPGDPAWRFIWVMWTGPALPSIWESLNQTNVRIFKRDASAAGIRFVQFLLAQRASGDPFRKTDAVDAYRLLLDLCHHDEESPSSRHGRRVVSRLEKQIRRRPAMPIGKDGLAASLSLSRFQLYRALRRETGLSPKDWLLRRRIDHACRLLRHTRKPIAEIAVEVGLPDANYFARLFRRRIGFTPRAWRKLFSAA
jgi:AraC-like DNA-binding protein